MRRVEDTFRPHARRPGPEPGSTDHFADGYSAKSGSAGKGERACESSLTQDVPLLHVFPGNWPGNWPGKLAAGAPLLTRLGLLLMVQALLAACGGGGGGGDTPPPATSGTPPPPPTDKKDTQTND